MGGEGLSSYFKGKIDEAEIVVQDKTQNLRRLEAQRNLLNAQGKRSLPRGHFTKTTTSFVSGYQPHFFVCVLLFSSKVTRRASVAPRAWIVCW